MIEYNEFICYTNIMKYCVFLLIFFSSSIALGDCLYEVIEQNKRFYVVKKILGELPTKNQEIKAELSTGIMDVVVTDKPKKETLLSSKQQEIRIKVRYEAEDKADAKEYLDSHCGN